MLGISGLLPPLRDVQLAAPAALCPLCGEEQLVCVRCANRQRPDRRRKEKEEREP